MGSTIRADCKVPVVLFGVTSGLSVRGFFRGQHRYLAVRGWRVALTCADEGSPATFASAEGADYYPISAVRHPSPLHDLRTLYQLVQTHRRVRPTIAVWGSPKIGLLGVLASRATRTPCIYVVHGLRLETARGIQFHVLRFAERLACGLAGSVIAVGHQLRAEMLKLNLGKAKKIRVISNGSANGVPLGAQNGALSGAPASVEIGFVGRITPDKGLADLVKAWPMVLRSAPWAKLVIVGGVDDHPQAPILVQSLEALPNVRVVGHVDDLTPLYQSLALVVLPTYREGLPNVILEAASHGVPAVTTSVTGASEPVVDGVTGIVVPPRNPDRLAEAICELLLNPEKTRKMGECAKSHVLETYNQEALWEAWHNHLLNIARTAHSGKSTLSRLLSRKCGFKGTARAPGGR